MNEQFAIAYSERNDEEAVKEIALKIKSTSSQGIKCILVFFTPQYQPLTILRSLKYTLNPAVISGIGAPLLIFDDRIIDKGVIVCVINKEGVILKDIFIKNTDSLAIEAAIRRQLNELSFEKQFVFSFVPSKISYLDYLRSAGVTFGKTFCVHAAGYLKKYSPKQYSITNNSVDEGLLSIVGRGLDISSLKLQGFLPVGKPFAITKAIDKTGMVMEINKKPALDIYRYYFEEKFDEFKKKNLFPYYPIGIKHKDSTHLLSVLQCLEDGSLICIGEAKEADHAQVMLLDAGYLFELIPKILQPLKKQSNGLVFMINSMIRKKLLGTRADEEVRLIKNNLGSTFKIIGIYSDYFVSPDQETREINMDASSLCLTLIK